VLLLLIWGFSLVCRTLHAELLGAIVAGLLLGPGVAGWIAYEKATYMVGRAGLILLVMEGGLGIDVAHFKKTWGLTTTIAISGTILPCAFGWLLLLAFNRGTLEGFAAGTALSSTSIGMSLMMLIQFDYLKTPLGGIIAVAAMVDDVASLVILAVLTEIGRNEGQASTATEWAWLVFKPLLVRECTLIQGVRYMGAVCGCQLAWMYPTILLLYPHPPSLRCDPPSYRSPFLLLGVWCADQPGCDCSRGSALSVHPSRVLVHTAPQRTVSAEQAPVNRAVCCSRSTARCCRSFRASCRHLRCERGCWVCWFVVSAWCICSWHVLLAAPVSASSAVTSINR
jgi:hypothetical protein